MTAQPSSGARCPINASGGVLSSNPIGASGLLRFAEAANQVRGAAGEHQVDGAKVAIGMAYGANNQYFSTWAVGTRCTRSTNRRAVGRLAGSPAAGFDGGCRLRGARAGSGRRREGSLQMPVPGEAVEGSADHLTGPHQDEGAAWKGCTFPTPVWSIRGRRHRGFGKPWLKYSLFHPAEIASTCPVSFPWSTVIWRLRDGQVALGIRRVGRDAHVEGLEVCGVMMAPANELPLESKGGFGLGW